MESDKNTFIVKQNEKYGLLKSDGTILLDIKYDNIEFSIDVSTVNLKDEYKGVNKDKVKLFLLQEFEKFKMEKYNWLKYQSLSNQYTP